MAVSQNTGERFGGELKRFGVERAGTPLKVVSPFEPAGQ